MHQLEPSLAGGGGGGGARESNNHLQPTAYIEGCYVLKQGTRSMRLLYAGAGHDRNSSSDVICHPQASPNVVPAICAAAVFYCT